MDVILAYLGQALQAIIIAVVPILTIMVIALLRAKSQKLQLDSENALVDATIAAVEKVITKAVTFVSQTYVDNLKKDGQFSVEEQKIAFRKAYDRVVQLIGDEQQQLISSLFGDFSVWLSTMIESAVKEQKA